MENIAELIYALRVKEADPKWICDVLERLMWLTEDNGKEICDTLTRWLASGDLEKIKIALACEEFFLFHTRGEMTQAFSEICKQHPELQGRCDEIVAAWDKQGLPA